MSTSRYGWRVILSAALSVAAGLTSGCSPDDLVGEGELPPGAQNPKDTQTHEGAMRAYVAALISGRNSTAGPSGSMVLVSGLISDEFTASDQILSWLAQQDRRVLPAYTDPEVEERIIQPYFSYIESYVKLQQTRSKTQVGEWLLRNFAPTESPALAAHLQATQGYADLYLADLYCSGIPLSTVDPDGYTLAAGSSTEEVYQKALALFDSALAGSSDSVNISRFAAIGKARALLALGQYEAAATAVADIPDGYQYQLKFDGNITGTDGDQAHDNSNFIWGIYQDGFGSGPGMSDAEGNNGLGWMADPRTEGAVVGQDYSGNPISLPVALRLTGDSPISMADWREARLIEAEAALHRADFTTFLDKINGLRAGVVFPPAPDDSTNTDRTLDPLSDPGDFDGRVDLLFRERGFWLFMTGHRQGDLRRLIREYGRDPSTVYPIGRHPSGGAYGSDVTAPVPSREIRFNPKYSGCQNRGA